MRKQEGISFLLIDMKAPGVEVRPILLINGTSPFCETFLDHVRVPRTQVMGEINKGWTVAKYLLEFERGVSTLGQQVGFARELEQITGMARANGSGLAVPCEGLFPSRCGGAFAVFASAPLDHSEPGRGHVFGVAMVTCRRDLGAAEPGREAVIRPFYGAIFGHWDTFWR